MDKHIKFKICMQSKCDFNLINQKYIKSLLLGEKLKKPENIHFPNNQTSDVTIVSCQSFSKMMEQCKTDN